MKIFLEITFIQEIREVARWGILGVTTNPTLLSKTTGKSSEESICEIAEIVNGDMSAKTVSWDTSGMLEEARRSAAWHFNVVAKVQEIFHIEEEAGYILSIKNPEHGTDPRFAHLAEQRKPQYPPDLRQRLQGHSFVPADPPTFLDYEGTQFLLISATEDVQKELGIELDAEQESLESADLFSDLKLARSERTVEPLIQGEWA